MKLVLAVFGACIYMVTMYSLLSNIIKIWKRGQQPPRIGWLILLCTYGRFAGWVLLGACVLDSEPVIAWMLISTRGVGTLLLSFAMLQKVKARPGLGLITRRLIPGMGVLVIATVGLSKDTVGNFCELPLTILVGASFLVYSFLALPSQIAMVKRNGTFGMLRIFQYGMLLNFVASFALGFFSADKGLKMLMVGAYGFSAILQAYFVYLLEQGRRSYRKQQEQVE